MTGASVLTIALCVNDSVLEALAEIRRLLELKGENPFKVRAFDKAISVLSDRSDLIQRVKTGTLTGLDGIGKSISEIITEIVQTGRSSVLEELRSSFPGGLLEITQVPGLGPKKALKIVQELGVRSLGELEYACHENRLAALPGFGEKLQMRVLEGVHFLNSHAGQRRWADVIPLVEEVEKLLQRCRGDNARVERVGALRRRCETLGELTFLVEGTEDSELKATVEEFKRKRALKIPVKLHFSAAEDFGYALVERTGTDAHWKALGNPKLEKGTASSEEAVYSGLGLPWIPPECRETGQEVQLARAGALELVQAKDLGGFFHFHTTESDGASTLEEMVDAAKARGYRFVGVSDHSQSAFYARGLTSDRLKIQEREIRRLQEAYPEVRIFWGIESDILADGSLDYPEEILKRFDFVIASIHSRFQMGKAEMTERVIAAIRNRHTRFLGHATGRLLLSRPGYELDMEKVIRAAADSDVAIEINANPARLDIDWRWGGALREFETRVSINPDAHSTDELEHMRFGLNVARKALLPPKQVLNSWTVKEIEKWLSRKQN